jgi:hypothetical protein
MRHLVFRAGLVVQLVWAAAVWAPGAAGQPGTGPRETVNQRFTATRAGTPTGVDFSASYHAAGDKGSPPPVLRRMVVRPPRGMRYDTSVPARCTASDYQLELMGPDACPPGSLLGRGTAEGLIMEPFAHDFAFDHFKHPVYVLNNANQQIVLIHSEGFTVVRGRFRPDGAIDWVLPTCFPNPPGAQCVDDYIIQLKTSSRLPRYTRTTAGRVRSYATTPPACPRRGYWRTRVRYWWGDGSIDSVVTKQPCRRPG